MSNKSPFYCENCSKTRHNLFILQLGEQTVAKERCSECHPKQIDIISSKLPTIASCIIGKISDFESLVAVFDVSRVWNEFDSSRSLIFVDSKYPQYSTLDEFSIFRLETGDQIEIFWSREFEKVPVRAQDKANKVISVATKEKIEDFTYEEIFQNGGRVVLENYKQKENWMKRCELPDDFNFKTFDWEIVNELAEIGDVNLLRIISVPQQIVKPLETSAAQYRLNLLRRSSQWLRKKDTPVKETVAFLLWKRRLTEDKFQMGALSSQQRLQELETYEKALQLCFIRTDNFQQKMSRSQSAKNYLQRPFLSIASKFRRHTFPDATL